MNIPNLHNLLAQTYNAEYLEFVWLFPNLEEPESQVMIKINKNESVGVGCWPIVEVNDGWLPGEEESVEYLYPSTAEFDSNVGCKLFSHFTNVKDVVQLVKESVDFLKE